MIVRQQMRISSISSVIRSWLNHQPFFLFYSQEELPHQGDNFIASLVIRSQTPLAEEEPEKKQTGRTKNESRRLELLNFAVFGGKWCRCGAPGRMECFHGNTETGAVEGKAFLCSHQPFQRFLHPLGCDKKNSVTIIREQSHLFWYWLIFSYLSYLSSDLITKCF